MPGGDSWQMAGKIDCPDGCMVDLGWLLRMLGMEEDAHPPLRPGQPTRVSWAAGWWSVVQVEAEVLNVPG